MNFDLLAASPLFQGLDRSELEAILVCLGAYEKTYPKEGTICWAGESIGAMGLLLAGRVRVETVNVWGNRNILDSVEPGQVFGETYACLPGEPMMVSVVAAEVSTILFLNVEKILATCPIACSHHSRLIRNLLQVTARKNLNLTHKIFHTAQKSIRGKLLSYLSFQALKGGSREFSIPFSRQQLADYLGVDRSALSAELGKMRREGLVEFRKNAFQIKTPSL